MPTGVSHRGRVIIKLIVNRLYTVIDKKIQITDVIDNLITIIKLKPLIYC